MCIRDRDWDQRFRVQADYQRTNGKTTIEKYLAEYEPQIRMGDRAFAFGLGRWERDRMQGFDARWSASGGLGYKLIDGKTMTLNLKAGPAWRQTELVTGGHESESVSYTHLDVYKRQQVKRAVACGVLRRRDNAPSRAVHRGRFITQLNAIALKMV